MCAFKIFRFQFGKNIRDDLMIHGIVPLPASSIAGQNRHLISWIPKRIRQAVGDLPIGIRDQPAPDQGLDRAALDLLKDPARQTGPQGQIGIRPAPLDAFRLQPGPKRTVPVQDPEEG